MTLEARLSWVLQRVASATTRVLATDALAAARLSELQDRIIALRLRGQELALFATVDAGGLLFATSTPREPDVSLTGSIGDFIAFARARQGAQPAPPGKLQIQGDLATARLVQSLLDELAIDWEELLADSIGDVAAHQVGRGLREGLRWLGEARRAWREDLTAYLLDEKRLVPTSHEVEVLARESANLLSAVDQLAARVERLRAQRERSC
jgi:ubiquinone biosynthesis accessory factor UbiJ